MAISLMSLNQKMTLLFYDYVSYKFLHEKSDDKDVSSIVRLINSAKEMGYVCKNKSLAINFIIQEVKKRSQRSYPYTISNCVELPTGELIISMSDSTVKYYVMARRDSQVSKSYYIQNIKGETLG